MTARGGARTAGGPCAMGGRRWLGRTFSYASSQYGDISTPTMRAPMRPAAAANALVLHPSRTPSSTMLRGQKKSVKVKSSCMWLRMSSLPFHSDSLPAKCADRKFQNADRARCHAWPSSPRLQPSLISFELIGDASLVSALIMEAESCIPNTMMNHMNFFVILDILELLQLIDHLTA